MLKRILFKNIYWSHISLPHLEMVNPNPFVQVYAFNLIIFNYSSFFLNNIKWCRCNLNFIHNEMMMVNEHKSNTKNKNKIKKCFLLKIMLIMKMEFPSNFIPELLHWQLPMLQQMFPWHFENPFQLDAIGWKCQLFVYAIAKQYFNWSKWNGINTLNYLPRFLSFPLSLFLSFSLFLSISEWTVAEHRH